MAKKKRMTPWDHVCSVAETFSKNLSGIITTRNIFILPAITGKNVRKMREKKSPHTRHLPHRSEMKNHLAKKIIKKSP